MNRIHTHEALICDAEPAKTGTVCDLGHDDETGQAADVRLYLATPIGIRSVHLCHQHDDATAPELVPGSWALDAAQAEPEDEVFVAGLLALLPVPV